MPFWFEPQFCLHKIVRRFYSHIISPAFTMDVYSFKPMCTASSQCPSTSYICLGTKTRTWFVVQKVCLSSRLQNIAMSPIVLKWRSGRKLPRKDVQVTLIPPHKYFGFFLRVKYAVSVNISHTSENSTEESVWRLHFYLTRSAGFTLGRNSLRSVEGYDLSFNVALFCKISTH
jgi:hypothetical protein